MNISKQHAMLHQLVPDTAPLLEQLLDLEQQPNHEVVVAACGLYNAGKSTLLNALGGFVEQEHFKTAAARETRQLQTASMQGLTLLDTPGLDADCDDDNTAFKGVLQADLLLMVHNPRNGELDQQELEYLANIQAQSEQPLHQRLMLVLSYGGELSAAEETRLLATIHQQFIELCGDKPVTKVVSATTYLDGVRRNKPALIAHSGVVELQQHLAEQHADLQSQRVIIRQQKQQRLRQLLQVEIDHALQQKHQLLKQARQQLASVLTQQEQSASALRRMLRERLTA
ncbi:hypothetical protein CBP31_13035 [Oceanisphaera profunda]|uniref:G domain-containing protein n=1 Tax=Oceanisphaera profunda TaxID=1416627 RepID=A0A1Y0D7A6_9GAMM|nr:GTPase [Oceanisphaera profunda]ART83431.1 hypothetical protein CBP31_13035 [Oceanisphaera profunda]